MDIPLDEFSRSDIEKRINEELNQEIDTGFNIPTNNDDFILPNAPVEAIIYPKINSFKYEAKTELKVYYEKKLDEYFKTGYNIDYTKFLDTFVNEDGDVFIKAKRDNDWSQITSNRKALAINKEFINVDDLTIVKSDDRRKNKTKNQNLIFIIKDPNYRVERIIDRTHPIEDTINDVSKIITEMGVEPDNLNELYKNRQIIKDPEIAKLLMTLKQHVDEYQKLLNEERDLESSKTLKPEEKEQRLKELKELIDTVENDVLEIVNGSLAREIDKTLNVPVLTKIRNILKREGLTIAAIAGIIGTVISTIFSIIFGVKSFSGNNNGPGPGPKPDPNVVEKIYKKIKEIISSTLNKLVEILKKLAAWALATLPAVIGPIVSWLFERAADVVKYVAENTFIIIMLLLGLGFKFIIDYLEKKKRRY